MRLGLSGFTQQMSAAVQKWNIGDGEMYEASKEVSQEVPAVGHGMADVYRQLGVKMQGEALHPAVINFVQALATAQRSVAQYGEMLGPTIRRANALDIARTENPRPHESGWNTPSGRRR